MKVTFIATLQDYWGGSEVLWVKAAELAAKEGHKLQIIVYGQKPELHPQLLELKKIAGSFIEMPNTVYPSSFLRKAVRSVKNKLIRYRLDVVTEFAPDYILVNQVHSFSAAFHPAVEALLLHSQIPYFLLSHFNAEHLILTFSDILKARAVFEMARKTMFVSQRNLQIAERQLACAIPRSSVIANHPRLDTLTLIPFPQETSLVHFATVARLEAQFKGQDILFQILSETQWKYRNWHLNIYGTGPDEVYLKELSQFYQIDSKVTFHGHVNNLEKIWQMNHILLMPSTAEGKPLALQEAMICGRIAVASDVAGNGELIDDGINGYLAGSFLPGPFSTTLEKAWSERHRWPDMGKKAHHKIMNNTDFSPHRTLLKIMSLR